MRKYAILGALVVGALALGVASEAHLPNALASSHREAPLIAQDPTADATDFYAFVSPDKPDTVTLIANYVPFQYPAGGPNFYPFGDDVLYRINIDNNGDAVADITYDFEFKSMVKDPNTFLYNTGPITSLDDATRNVPQTYTLTRTKNGARTVLGTNLSTPPAYVGSKSTPDYNALAAAAVHDLHGTKVFAGQRDDPFFVDLGSTFDLLTIRPGPPGNKGGGYDDLAGFNVNSLAIQVPTSELTNSSDPNIGAWTTSYRRSTRVLDGKGAVSGSGDWVQVSRLGHPLVNEVVVPLGFKDYWNSSKPSGDAAFLGGVTDPEPARLLHALYGLNVPPTPRNDLVAIFLTGIDGVNQPKNVKPSEELRLNTSIAPASYNMSNGTAAFFGARCGLLAGDSAGYPNGRRLSDDVVDIALQAVAGGTPFTPKTNVAPNNQLGDGVDENDVAFLASFPYVAPPHSGSEFLQRHTQAPPGHGCGN